jgi:CBS domain containing-hemolysin-like protein
LDNSDIHLIYITFGRFLVMLFLPISWPISWALDRCLGREGLRRYTRKELATLMRVQNEASKP